MNIDAASLLIGFLVGLIVFQVRGVKKILEVLGFLGAIVFMLTLMNTVLNTRNLNSSYKMIISFFVGGVLGNLVYLIGANISRYIQFGTLSLKIIVYIMLIALILVIFSNLVN